MRRKETSGRSCHCGVKKRLALLLCVAMTSCIAMPAAAAESETKIGDGTVVQVTKAQALTYNPKTTDNVPNTAYYPLPKGTRDTVVGKRISYTKNGSTYYYYNLKSGLRISAGDVKAVNSAPPSGNIIRNMSVSANGDYTYVKLQTDQKVVHKVRNEGDYIMFTFANTSQTPASVNLSGMFKKATWDDKTLRLYFSKPADFFGYKAYYSDDTLVLRFNEKPASLAEARIAIDAGHGGKDKGALGTDSNFHEKDINRAIANLLAEELESRGADVLLIEGDGHSSQWRKETAEAWEADILISIHCNASASNPKAAGTEVYYYRNYGEAFAKTMSEKVSANLDTINRGAKRGIYRVALSPQMQSLLVETGFVTNAGEYQKLIQSGYQNRVATGIADAIEITLEGA